MQGVFPRIDNFTIMIRHNSIANVLFVLGLSADDLCPLTQNGYVFCNLGSETWGRVSFNGVNIWVRERDIRFNEVAYIDSQLDFVYWTFDNIRLELTGTGLEFLRSRDFLPERELFKLQSSDDFTFSITRMEIAYDFVNTHGDLYNKMASYLWRVQLDKELDRVPLYHKLGSGIKFSVRSGAQKTIYLGSNQSDKLVRIYDKMYQLCPKGVWTKKPYFDCDPSDIKSWIRIEYQLRGDSAEKLFYSYSDDWFLSVLKDLYNRFAFRDLFADGPSYIAHVVDFWQDLMDWEEIPLIIQNANFV